MFFVARAIRLLEIADIRMSALCQMRTLLKLMGAGQIRNLVAQNKTAAHSVLIKNL